MVGEMMEAKVNKESGENCWMFETQLWIFIISYKIIEEANAVDPRY